MSDVALFYLLFFTITAPVIWILIIIEIVKWVRSKRKKPSRQKGNKL